MVSGSEGTKVSGVALASSAAWSAESTIVRYWSSM